MKSLSILPLLLLAIVSAGHAETTTQRHPNLEATIIALDRQGWEAWKHNDPSWYSEEYDGAIHVDRR